MSQFIIFSAFKYTLTAIINSDFSIKGFVVSFIPSNYFIILYIVVFLISPYLNLIFENLDSKKRKFFIELMIVLFSVYPTVVDALIEVTKHSFNGLSSISMYGSQYGYTIVNFMLCYCIGAYIRFEDKKMDRIKTSRLLLVLLVCFLALTCWSVVNNHIGFYAERTAWEYCNPIVILSGMCMFLLFKRINIRNNKGINSFAKASLTVYLLHDSLVAHIGIEDFVNRNIAILVLHILLTSIGIYFVCWLISVLYSKFEKYVFGYLEKKYNALIIDV